MKRTLSFIAAALMMASCGNRTSQNSEGLPLDSLTYHVITTIADSNRTCLEVKDEMYALIDSLQERVESWTDEEIRIGAKSFALDLCDVLMNEEFCSPEETRFFLDSLAARLSSVLSTWYCPTYVKEEIDDPLSTPVMTQDVVFRDKWEGVEHVICLDYYDTPDYGETVIITLPADADYLATIMFNNDGFDNISELTYSQEDALHVLEHEEGGLSLLFGRDLLEAMLTNDGMFIGYIGKELNEERECLFYDCHLILSRFQEQFTQLQ